MLGFFGPLRMGVLGFLIALFFGACGAAPPRPTTTLQLPLTDYLPAGAHFVVVAAPSEVMAQPALAAVVGGLISAERFDAFRAHNGIDPRTLEALAYAEYQDEEGRPLGTVLAIRGPFNARVAVGEMAHRMIPVESENDEPYFRRGGVYAGARRDAIAIDQHTLVLVSGAPRLASEALDIAGSRALTGDGDALLATLSGPVVVLFPRPLGLPLGSDLALLMARERALALAVSGQGADSVALRAEARGEFPPGIEDNLRTLVGSLAVTDLGHQLGMAELQRSLELALTPTGVSASGEVSSGTLLRGLRALLVAEISEIVGVETLGAAP